MDDAVPQWRSMPPEEVAREYAPSTPLGGNFLPFVEGYQVESDRARAACADLRTLSYGPSETQTIDLALPPNPQGAPLFVFIHGGYWQHHSKLDSFFGADIFTGQGVAYAAVDYTLAPHASLPEIVEECRAALRHLFEAARSLGIDPGRITVGGSSAGAHLSAMCCADPALGPKLSGVVLLSGIFELEPFMATPDNEAVGLTLEQAESHSPMRLPVDTYPDTVVTWGAVETDEFKRQSRAMAARLSTPGRQVHVFESPSKNHFDLVHNLYDPATDLGRAVMTLAKGAS